MAYLTVMVRQSRPDLVLGLVLLVLSTPVRWASLRRRGGSTTWAHEVWLAVFALWLAGLLSLTLELSTYWWFPLCYGVTRTVWWFGGGVNLSPFVLPTGAWEWTMLVGNVLLFLPMGLLMPVLWRRERLRDALVAGLALSLGIEVVQLVLGRFLDVQDLLLNVLGAGLGWGLWAVVGRPKARVRIS